MPLGPRQTAARRPRLAGAPARVLGTQRVRVLRFLGTEFAVKALLGRPRTRLSRALAEKLGGTLLHADRDAKQTVRVAR